jgi:hypothetical protein
MFDTMTDTAHDLAPDEVEKPYPVRTAISAEAGRALAERQLQLGLTYPGHKKGGRKWPLAAIAAEILEAYLLPNA